MFNSLAYHSIVWLSTHALASNFHTIKWIYITSWRVCRLQMWGSTGRREGTYDLVNVGRDAASDQILGGEAKKLLVWLVEINCSFLFLSATLLSTLLYSV